jgi:hypothetical protein
VPAYVPERLAVQSERFHVWWWVLRALDVQLGESLAALTVDPPAVTTAGVGCRFDLPIHPRIITKCVVSNGRAVQIESCEGCTLAEEPMCASRIRGPFGSWTLTIYVVDRFAVAPGHGVERDPITVNTVGRERPPCPFAPVKTPVRPAPTVLPMVALWACKI